MGLSTQCQLVEVLLPLFPMMCLSGIRLTSMIQNGDVQKLKTQPKRLGSGDILIYTNMGVSKNRGTQKWMVYNGKPY